MDQLPRLGKRKLICLLSFTCNMWFLFGGVFSALFYCCTPWAFHIIIFIRKSQFHQNLLEKEKLWVFKCLQMDYNGSGNIVGLVTSHSLIEYA